MRIGHLDLSERVMVVAEIGNNHEGRAEVARELFRRAADAGADAVKLQTFETALFVRPRDEARFAQLSAFQLSREDVEGLCGLARELGLLFLSTPFDLQSAAFLEPLVDAYKIASGDNDFYPLIDRVSDTAKPVIVSSGLMDTDGIRASKERIEGRWRERGVDQEVAVLHCVSAYPVRPDHANLAAIPMLADRLGCVVGYSDHTIGNDACVIAAALGARILEKHFTLSHDFSAFRDHQLSAEPAELRDMVERVRASVALTGAPEKRVQPEEEEVASAVRRSIAAASDLPRGHRLRQQDLIWLRPRDGLAPGQEGELLERALTRDIAHGESIVAADVE